MTYRELANRINQLNDYQKDCHVTYKHADEYYGKLYMDFADVRTEDRLDGWHPYIAQFETDAVN
jgi:hypothetical protein